ncbi:MULTISPECIES: hypothetical protein [unclassified Niallia]|uniref:hypothetical protein n=1 Tax=unclassified Niallia TaxID=2837522 RepID=UPI001EDC743B|nr:MULTISPECIES: hypothetical protein [unclassified Niallia]MDL0436373.1 hypothetical protein [Niallia sp. SS-2023]UPO89228.1 hypothetical protein L8T27_008820 [Niallia sp. Man26]
MKQVPRFTDYYDNQLLEIDEQICSLLQQRKILSNDNPGVPPEEILSSWANQYELYPNFLYQLFGAMNYDHIFKSTIEPVGFRKQIAVQKVKEIAGRFYSLTVIRQYENTSVIKLHVDWEESEETPIMTRIKKQNPTYALNITDKQYECRNNRSGGSTGHYTYSFIVSPALPDDVSGIRLIFKEYRDFLMDEPTGLEIKMNL